ncbi:MAG: NgoFVII family restriction endonuclease [Chitinophagaceae bacterium]|nr:MAG: phospholipase D/transphosphatidylase [Bacteroidetes bacterium OLB11]MCC6447540.1 NgoFVII family restriction endonuclease [Chitinophagaceae bacterium]HMN32983.1 phospholipase D-like domain-containing protein [Chitinophagaceae bacterium]
MKIVTTPWKNELFNLIKQSQESIKITSPFVKHNICEEILNIKKSHIKFELITDFKLRNIYLGSVDLDALEKIINNSGVVKNFSKLHSKIYLFDNKKAIITSGNLTNGGLLNNFEYGIYTDEQEIVSKIANDFYQLSSNENTGIVKNEHIKEVRQLLLKVPNEQHIRLPKFDIENQKITDADEDSIILDIDSIGTTFKGWKLEVFKCANKIPNTIFSLADINTFEKALKQKYPNNNHIPDKIRQQLQNLRDIGLIEFLGNGNYKKLWEISTTK